MNILVELQKKEGGVFREDREEEDGGFELYKSILFKYLMITVFIFFFRYFNDNDFDFKLRGTESNQPK